jgi:hypothetical protein
LHLSIAMGNFKPKNVKLYSIHERTHKVQIKDFAEVPSIPKDFGKWIDGLPNILAAKDLKEIIAAIVKARQKNKPVIAMIGGHVIKCGVTPLLIDWMKKGILTGMAMNGSASIHDTEIALIGQTSEDVAVALDDGTFGMVKETGAFIHAALKEGNQQGWGMGQSIGYKINKVKMPYRDKSLLANADKLGIPVTVHTAIGTDTIYQHPDVDGAVMGETSLRDFYRFAEMLKDLNNGGVILNIGSAVILPEVFLKTLTIARNLGYPVAKFTSANFDMIQHYRPRENVVKRPTRTGGKGYTITGHHEIMIPLLYAGVMAKMKESTHTHRG